jgi:hypothetical protein
MPDFALGDLHPLGERAKMVAPVALRSAHPAPGDLSETAEMIDRDRLAVCLQRGRRPIGVCAGLVAGRLEFGNAVLEGRIVQVGKPALNGGIKSLEPGVGFRRPFGEFGGDGAPA